MESWGFSPWLPQPRSRGGRRQKTLVLRVLPQASLAFSRLEVRERQKTRSLSLLAYFHSFTQQRHIFSECQQPGRHWWGCGSKQNGVSVLTKTTLTRNSRSYVRRWWQILQDKKMDKNRKGNKEFYTGCARKGFLIRWALSEAWRKRWSKLRGFWGNHIPDKDWVHHVGACLRWEAAGSGGAGAERARRQW